MYSPNPNESVNEAQYETNSDKVKHTLKNRHKEKRSN